MNTPSYAMILGMFLVLGCTASDEISCYDTPENEDCVCRDNQVRVETAQTGMPSQYICKAAECDEDNDCIKKYGDAYACYKTDPRDLAKGWCAFGLTTN